MRNSWTAALACGLGLAWSVPLFAQRTTGGIVGTVKDESGATLPGVAVSVSGPNIAGVQSATTNDAGFYRFISLPPGEYELKFSRSGFKTEARRGVRVGLGTTLEENAALAVSQLQEQVDVVADAPVVDTSSNEVGANYGREWVESAPLRRFSFFDLVAAAPGSLQGGDSNNSSRTMVYGSSYDENAFQVDGVDVTDNFFNEALAQPNTDAIEEVEVLSLGAPAEYGNLTGAVYNIVTRQGTNEFHGDMGFYFQSDGLTSNNTKDFTNPDGTFLNACPDGVGRCPWTRDKFTDFTAQLGGPIVEDKLWFFASYGNQRDYVWDVGVDSSNPLTAVRERGDRYFGKLNWQINAKHKLVGTFHLDDKADDSGLALNSAPTTAITRFQKTPTPGLGYTGVLSERTVVEVRYSGFYGDVSQAPTDPGQARDLNRFYDIDTGFISGGHYYWYELGPQRTTVTAKVSHLAEDFLGANHDFRFGVQYSDAEAGGLVGYNDLIFTYSQTSPGYGYGYAYSPFSYKGNTRAVGGFVDDTVRVNDRLSLNLGLRYDYNKAFSGEQDQLDDDGNPTGDKFPQTDFFTWNTISPRLGFNWKLTADGKTVLKGHYGRYYRAVATGEYANKVGPSISPIFSGPYDVATGEFGDLTLSKSNENLSVDPDYEAPYTDQFIASLERELTRGFGAQLNYINKRGRRYPGWEATGEYVLVPYVDDDFALPTGRTIQLFQLVSDPEDREFRITNPPDQHSDIHSVSLGLFKHMSDKWQLTASATWLRATGTLQEGQGGAGEAGSGVGIIQRGGLQFRAFGQNPNSYVNVDGRLKSDVAWQFKVQAVYKLPAGFLVSANFSNRSGAHLVRRTRALRTDYTHIPENTPILLQPRGENGRLDDVTILDARLQKDFRLGEKVHLSAFADAFNLLNSSTHQGVVTSLVESSSFLYPLEPLTPRRLMLGAKLKF